MCSNIVAFIHAIKSNYRKKRRKQTRSYFSSHANYLFQVQEYSGNLWLTYNGNLVCPMAMFVKDPIEALEAMRKLYVFNMCGEEQVSN